MLHQLGRGRRVAHRIRSQQRLESRRLLAVVATLEEPAAEPVATLVDAPVVETVSESGGAAAQAFAVRSPAPAGKTGGDDVSTLASPLLANFAGTNFDTEFSNANEYHIPPDPIGAAGPNHLVSVTNASIEYFTKTGTKQFTKGLGLHGGSTANSFFAALSPLKNSFDPKVIYDQHAGRFVVVALERTDTFQSEPSNTSRIFVAVSDDSDPNGTWRVHAINGKINIGGTDTWADYPGLAVDEDAIYITANMFNFGGVRSQLGQRLWIINKTPFYTGGAASVTVHDPYTAVGLGFSALMPAMIYGAGGLGATTGTYLVGSGWSSGINELLAVIRVDNPVGAVSFSHQFVNLGNIHTNGAAFSGAPQLGTANTLDAGDQRIQNAVWRNNRLYAVNTVVPPSGPDAGAPTAHWFNINTTTPASLSLVDQGNIGGEDIAANTHTFYPSIAVDSLGNIGVGFAASAAAIYPGAYYTQRKSTDAAGTVQASGVLQAGTDWYLRLLGGTRNRWGDYSGIAVDPADDRAFWLYNEYAMARGTLLSGEDGRWATRWGKFAVNTNPTASANGPYTIDEGGTLNLNAAGSADADGDALTYSWDVNNDNVFGDATGASPTLTWAQLVALGINDGPTSRSVRVRVDDALGGVVTSLAATLTVNNVPPTAGVTGPSSGTAGVSLNFTMTANDPSAQDQAAGFMYLIDWDGDGTTDQTVSGPGAGTVVAHTFAAAGNFTVKVKAKDDDNGTSVAAAMWPITITGAAAQQLAVVNLDVREVRTFDAAGTGSLFADAADGLLTPIGATYDANGNLYVSDVLAGSGRVYKFNSSGTGSIFADIFDGLIAPTGMTVDAAGNLYVANYLGDTITKITPAGVGSVFADAADGLNGPFDVVYDAAGDNFYVAALDAVQVWKFTSAGVGTLFADAADGLRSPISVAVDAAGSVFVADVIAGAAGSIFKFTPAGVGSVFADALDGVIAPTGIAFDAAGNLYSANYLVNTVTKLTPAGVGSVFADGSDGLVRPFDVVVGSGGGSLAAAALAAPSDSAKTVSRRNAWLEETMTAVLSQRFERADAATQAVAMLATDTALAQTQSWRLGALAEPKREPGAPAIPRGSSQAAPVPPAVGPQKASLPAIDKRRFGR